MSEIVQVPLFPLSHVLMPGCALPLRIFEPRYLRLLDDITGDGGTRRFGVAALRAGLEVENAHDETMPRFATVGTIAEILELHPAGDGTINLLTGGSSKFEIVRVIESEAPYLVAEVSLRKEPVEYLPAGLLDATQALSTECARLIASLLGREHAEGESYTRDDILTSYRLSTEAPLDIAEHQQLLEDGTATERLLRLQRLLRREVILLRRTRTMAVSPARLQAALGLN